MIGTIDRDHKDRITKEEVTMRFAFATLILSVCSLALGQDVAQMPSVINHGAAAQTAAIAPAAAAPAPAAPIMIESAPAPATIVVAETSRRCRNGRCGATDECRVYDVEESVTESCRPRLLGGYVKRNTARTVYRPSRR